MRFALDGFYRNCATFGTARHRLPAFATDLSYLETSAKTGKNVGQAFKQTAQHIFDNIQDRLYVTL